jgi:broad specificity phosphatase PhoE
MRKLILIKHSKPEIVPTIPSHQWSLSEEGRAKCALLAERIKPHDPANIVASEEPKARETGRLLADALGKPFQTADGLQEHDRREVPHMPSGEFLSWMALFFQKPDQRVIGGESANEASERFSAAVDRILKANPDGNLALVTHGTVLSLFLASHTDKSGYALFRQLGLPSFAVLELPEMKVVEMVDRVGGENADKVTR